MVPRWVSKKYAATYAVRAGRGRMARTDHRPAPKLRFEPGFGS